MEYSTSRIRLRKLSPAPPERISIASQYKNIGPILTPRRKNRTISLRRKGTTKVPKVVNAGSQGTGSKRPRLGILPAQIPQSNLQQSAPLDSAISPDENSIEWTVYNDADSPSSHSVDVGDDLSAPLNSSPADTVLQLPDKFAPGGYQLFFESVISGGLPFYQLSKKTFVANGWNNQKSEASVSLVALNSINEYLIS